MTARTSAEAPLQQFEILSEEPSGHQMAHRVTAPDKVTAVELVEKLWMPAPWWWTSLRLVKGWVRSRSADVRGSGRLPKVSEG